MGLDRARESSMQPGRELNPFAHTPPSNHRRLSLFVFLYMHANTNASTNRPWVISLFEIPTVTSGHGDGSSDAPLTALLKINTHQLLVLCCLARRSLNVFDKGKRLGIYFCKLAADCGSRRELQGPVWIQAFPPASTPAFQMCLFCYEGIS